MMKWYERDSIEVGIVTSHKRPMELQKPCNRKSTGHIQSQLKFSHEYTSTVAAKCHFIRIQALTPSLSSLPIGIFSTRFEDVL